MVERSDTTGFLVKNLDTPRRGGRKDAGTPSAVISAGQKIRQQSFETEIKFIVEEPGDARVDVFMGKNLGQVLKMYFEVIGIRGIVESHEDGIVSDPNVAIGSAENGGGKMPGIPGIERGTQTLTELETEGLGDEGHRHLAIADIEI